MADGGQEVPVGPVGSAGHGWRFEWRGLLPLAVIVVAAIVGWRTIGATGGDGDDSEAPEVVATTTTSVAVTTSVVASSTTAPTTVPATTTTARPGPTVNIVGEMKPCRFGDNCLVASFTIAGFDETSGRFTCIYPNSTREFSFRDDGKDDACITADEGDTIIIEVDGVRSAAISEDDLDG